MVIELQLSQGKIAIIDDEFSELASFKWSTRRKQTRDGCPVRYYAFRISHKKSIHLHRAVLERALGRTLARSEEVDHIDHDGLNNRLSNLRIATKSQNMQNARKTTKGNTSQYKGVYRDYVRRKWGSCISVNNKTIGLGRFDLEIDAAIAYNNAALKYFGEFANINKISK